MQGIAAAQSQGLLLILRVGRMSAPSTAASLTACLLLVVRLQEQDDLHAVPPKRPALLQGL
jgi:hypothetical protein